MNPEVVVVGRKYLIFAATGVGLGHLLSALIAAAYYAWRTGRDLALDMREVHFFASSNHKAFFDNFALRFPPDLQIITDLSIIGELRKTLDIYYLRLEDKLDVDAPFPHKVLMVPCIAPGEPYRRRYRRAEVEFHIDLKGPLLEAFKRAQAMPQWGTRVIGLHYRATIGELFDRMTKLTVPDYDVRYARIMDEYVLKALSLVDPTSRDSHSFFVASDDRGFVKEMTERLPNAFSLSAKLLDREFADYVRANNFDISILMDAVVDMWSLSQCEQFIYSRSAFSNFAILNSTLLDETNTHYVHMPLFDEVLNSVDAATAVEWARSAVYKVESKRMHYTKSHQSLIQAIDRAVSELQAERARVKQRMEWHWQVTQSPDVDGPSAFEARAWEREGRNEALLARAYTMIQKFPGNPFLLSGYGGSVVDLLTRLSRFAEAAEVAQQAVGLAPDDAFLSHALGLALIRCGRSPDAEPFLRRSIELDPNVPYFYGDLADCLTRQGKVSEALDVVETATEANPADASLRARLGEALLSAGRFDAAADAFGSAVSLNPRDPAYFHRLSIARERQGRLEEAIQAADQGAAADPKFTYCRDRAAALRSRLSQKPTLLKNNEES